jgi:hypothetical protein
LSVQFSAFGSMVARRAAVYAAAAGILWLGFDGYHYLRGDGEYYYLTARSLLDDADLDLTNQLGGLGPAHDTEVALAHDGRVVPKHPVLLPLAALPFIAALGMRGALVFNFVQLALLLFALYRLALRVARPSAAAAAVLLTGLGTVLPHYAWNFSPDIFAALLLAGALLVLPPARSPTGTGSTPIDRRALLAGVLLGLACTSKFALVLFVPGIVLLCAPPRARTAAWVAAGLAVPLLALTLYQWHTFGSPVVTSYDRIAVLADGLWITRSQRADFTLPWRAGARLLLFDRSHGLLWTSVLTLPSFLALALLARRQVALALYLGASSLALFFFYSTYRLWYTSHYGNRFLIPAIALMAIPLAAALDGVARRLVHR